MYQNTEATMSMDCKESNMRTSLLNIKNKNNTKDIDVFIDKLIPLLSKINWKQTLASGVIDKNAIGGELATKIVYVLRNMNIEDGAKINLYKQISQDPILSICIRSYENESNSFNEIMHEYIDSLQNNDTSPIEENTLQNTELPVDFQNTTNLVFNRKRQTNPRKNYTKNQQQFNPENQEYKSRYWHRRKLKIRPGLSTLRWLMGKRGGKSKRSKSRKSRKFKR